MWSHQASAPSIFLSATSTDSYFYLCERRTILNCSNSDLSILCLIPYLASSMITLLISIYYQFYSIKKKKYNLSLTLLHPWNTTASLLPMCCQTYWRSSLHLLCTGISLTAQGTATWNLDSSSAYSEVIRSLYLSEPMASPIFICIMCQNGPFFLKLSPLLVLVTLLSAHPKIYLFLVLLLTHP